MVHWYQLRSCSPLWLDRLNHKAVASQRKSCLSNRRTVQTGPHCLPAGFPSTSAGTWCCHSRSGSSGSASPGRPSALASAAPLRHLEGRELTETHSEFVAFHSFDKNVF